MEEGEWTPCRLSAEAPVGPRDRPIDIAALEVCPGWLVMQEAVMECAQAALALKQGHLAEYFPELQAGILEGAMLGVQAFNVYEAEQMQRAGEK